MRSESPLPSPETWKTTTGMVSGGVEVLQLKAQVADRYKITRFCQVLLDGERILQAGRRAVDGQGLKMS